MKKNNSTHTGSNALTELSQLLSYASNQEGVSELLQTIERKGIPEGENEIRRQLQAYIQEAQQNVAARASEQKEVQSNLERNYADATNAEESTVSEAGKNIEAIATAAEENIQKSLEWGEAEQRAADKQEEGSAEEQNTRKAEEIRKKFQSSEEG